MQNTEDAVRFFTGLSTAEQLRFLVAFSHRLTIAARDTYEVQKDGLTDPNRLRTINEVQHRVSAHALALLSASIERYPDDVLIKIFLEGKSQREHASIMWAFQNARATLRHDS